LFGSASELVFCLVFKMHGARYATAIPPLLPAELGKAARRKRVELDPSWDLCGPTAMRWSTRAVSALLGHALPGVTGLHVHADQRVLRVAMEDVWSDFDAE